MVDTEEFIQLLKDDNQTKLEEVYSNFSSSKIDFTQVYNEIKDIEGNSSVYRVLGTFIYMWAHHGTESEQAKGLYYLKKSEKLGNKGAKMNIVDILTIRPHWTDDNAEWVDLAADVVKMMDSYIELEEKCDELEKRNKELEMENLDLKYRPNGVGYMEAKVEFESFCD